MFKSKRMVIMIEPALFRVVKKAADQTSLSLSEIVRSALKLFVKNQMSVKKTKKLVKLAQFKMSLDGIESPEKLKKILEEGYQSV